MRTLPVTAVALALAAALAVGAPAAAPPAHAQEASWPPADCPVATDAWQPVVGTVGCVSVTSPNVGGATPLSYYVPPVCATTTCPVVYNLHGFGGDHTSQLGTAQDPSAWVAALDARPPVPPDESDEPWTEADPAGWEPAPPLALIQVTTYGRTVPGGFGPRPGLESFYSDWNPRYAEGGADQAYDTPPPRFASFLLDEVLPFVETHFPTRSGRAWRAITGVSLGGFGSYKLGLAHPDRFAAVGSVSGAHNFLFAPAPDDRLEPDTSAPFVVDLGAILLPSVTGGATLPLGPAEGFTVPFTAYGGVAADQPYYRGNMPVDLARNARAYDADGAQLPTLTAIVNDAVPRRGEDVTDPGGYAGAQALEAIVLAMNQDQELAFDRFEVARTFAIHPGLHDGVYWNPWLRQHLEQLAAALAEPGSDPAPTPATRFDHRSIAASFTAWGWRFDVDRDTVEFLDLTDVTCDALTLRGTGTVTVDVPDRCGTGLAADDGSVADPFTVDLGPGAPTVAQTGVNTGAATVTVELSAAPDGEAPGGSGDDGSTGGAPGGPETGSAGLPATGGGAGGAVLGLGLVALAAAGGGLARRPRTP